VLTTYGTMAAELPQQHKQVAKKGGGRGGGRSGPAAAAAAAMAAAAAAMAAAHALERGLPPPSEQQLVDDSDEGEPAGGEDGPGGKPKAKRRTHGDEGGPLYRVEWHRVVLDEAQSIKNARTMAAHAAWGLHARSRWCLSGTPIQNSIDDLYPYFRFLRYEPYGQARSFKAMLKDVIAARPDVGFQRLQAVLSAVMLRRTKGSTIDGEPIVALPPRTETLVRQPFTAQEATFYASIEAEARERLAEMARAPGGSVGSQYINMLYLLGRLRQACNHPWLVKGLGAAFGRGAPPPAEVAAARKLAPETRASLAARLAAADSPCPVCGDLAEQPAAALCGHIYCRQCAAAQLGGGGADGEFACVTCSSTVRANSIFSAAALQAASGGPAAPAAPAPAATDASGKPVEWVSSAKIDRLLALLADIRAGSSSPRSGTPSGSPSAGAGGAPAAGAPPAAERPGGFALAARNKADARVAAQLRRLPDVSDGPPSAPGRAAPPADKVIVFSQWTSMLDLLEAPLRGARHAFRRLDGTMSVAARERAVADFTGRPDVFVLLVSLKAAALGLNLVAANHVVLLDLWWNPTQEAQAIDRAHRIGQTREVRVTRITIPGTVEDRILGLQARKQAVVDAALSCGGAGGAASGGQRLTLEDLHFLFG